MISGTVAKRYVHALYELAGENDALERVGEELAAVRALLERETELRTVLVNPAVDPDDKIAVFDGVVGDQVGRLTANFIRLLIRKGRMDYQAAMAEEYAELERKRKGLVVIRVATARELPENARAELQRSLESAVGSSVEMETTVRPELIGGMVARVGDTVYDGSVEHQLDLIQQRLGKE